MKVVTFDTLNDVDSSIVNKLKKLVLPNGRMAETLSFYGRAPKVLRHTAAFIAYDGDVIVGWATYDGNFDTFVRKSRRGEGVGTKLVLAGQQFIKKNGLSAPRALVHDVKGERLYGKMSGWVVKRER